MVFWSILQILGVILGPSWAPRGPKIEHFGTRKHQKSEKWCSGRGDGKSLKIRWDFDWKMVAWVVQNHWFFIVFSIESCFWRFSKNLENFIENGSKMLPKSINNLTFGARGPNLFDFGRILEESNFWWCFVSLFGASQSEKCRFGGRQHRQKQIKKMQNY